MKIELIIDNPEIIKDNIRFYEFQSSKLNPIIWDFTSMASIQIKFSHKGIKGSLIRNSVCMRDDTGYCFECEVLPSLKNADGYFLLNKSSNPIYVKKLYVGSTDENYKEFCTHILQSCIKSSKLLKILI